MSMEKICAGIRLFRIAETNEQGTERGCTVFLCLLPPNVANDNKAKRLFLNMWYDKSTSIQVNPVHANELLNCCTLY